MINNRNLITAANNPVGSTCYWIPAAACPGEGQGRDEESEVNWTAVKSDHWFGLAIFKHDEQLSAGIHRATQYRRIQPAPVRHAQSIKTACL